MKNILFILLVALSFSACQKDLNETIVGTWTEAQHTINGSDAGASGEISFFADGTYTTTEFTYPWHCNPCANTPDSGTWTYDENNETLTLKSTKNQTYNCMGTVTTYPNDTQVMNVVSFTDNEIRVQFNDVSCGQNVEITFQR